MVKNAIFEGGSYRMGLGSMRAGLSAIALLAVYTLSPCLAQEAKVTSGTIYVKTNQVIGTISPDIYGHFTEHIGGVIYDGIWVGPDSKVPNIDGIRKELIDYMKRLNPPVIRWPGGCFADRYHWMDGIGPRDKRPRRYGRWSEVTESNQFGTHEFIEFCRLCGSEPYFAANVGTGTPEEFQSWIEYCNAPAGRTTYAEMREQNGDKDPLKVKFWGVGNENWGCGGNYIPEDYCMEYRKFVTWLPNYSQLYLVACGPNGNDINWTKRFMKKWVDCARVPIDGWSCHYYCGTTGSALDYTADQWYEMLNKANFMETLVRDQWNTLAEFDPNHHIKLVIDEWGCWHPAGTEINKDHLFEQMSTLRDAEVAAITLDTFNRNCDKVGMANVAQLINNLHSLFLADGPKFVATPNFYVFEMYKVHQGAECVAVDFDAPFAQYKIGNDNKTFPSLLGSASIKDKKLHLSVVNTNVGEAIETTINLGAVKVKGGTQSVLTAKDIHAHNTFEKPNDVVTVTSPLAVSGSAIKHTFPPASITMLEMDLE